MFAPRPGVAVWLVRHAGALPGGRRRGPSPAALGGLGEMDAAPQGLVSP